jgi:hypothetical protein
LQTLRIQSNFTEIFSEEFWRIGKMRRGRKGKETIGGEAKERQIREERNGDYRWRGKGETNKGRKKWRL